MKYFLIIAFLVAFTFANAISLDSLESWAHGTFWGHYASPESLEFARYLAIARGDWQIAAFISAGGAFSKFGTIDSAMYDIAYCLAKTGDFEGAEEAIRRARKLYGKNDPQVQYIRSLLAIWSGNGNTADKIIQSALRKASSDEARQFLQIAGGIISTFEGDIKNALKMFQHAENISRKGTGSPRFEARMLGQSIQQNAVSGTLYIRQHYGRPCAILRIRPIFDWQDGSRYAPQYISMEHFTQMFGSPYFQLGIERNGLFVMPRWSGIPIGGTVSLWIVYVDKKEIIDSVFVNASGFAKGFPAADSFAISIQQLRKKAIHMWFDSLMAMGMSTHEPFWRFILSYQLASALSDTERWDMGIAMADSIIAAAPYLDDMYLWRGAFSLFKEDFDDAFHYFAIPVRRDSCALQALYNAGVAKFLAGEYFEAEGLWLYAVDCDNDFAPPHMALGVLYQDVIGDFAAAYRHYDQYLKVSNFLRSEIEWWMEEMK